jgi:WD40 repeat protein
VRGEVMKGIFPGILLVLLVFSSCAEKSAKQEVNQELTTAKSEEKHQVVKLSDSLSPLTTLKGHNGYIYYIDISPDGKYMVSGSSDKTIKLWDISRLPQIKEIASVTRLYSQLWGPPVKFSKDGQYIFSGSYDYIEVFTKDLKFIDNLRITDKGIQSIEVSKNSNLIFASDVNGFVYVIVFDNNKLELIKKEKVHDKEIWKVKYNEKLGYIVTASQDKTSKVLNPDSLSTITTLKAHSGPLEFADISNEKIALFSEDATISIWDFNFNLLGKLYDDDKMQIIVGTFSPDGKFIISGSKSTKIKIWSVDKMELIKTLEWHKNDVMSVKITPDGKFIISGDRDGNIAVWSF